MPLTSAYSPMPFASVVQGVVTWSSFHNARKGRWHERRADAPDQPDGPEPDAERQQEQRGQADGRLEEPDEQRDPDEYQEDAQQRERTVASTEPSPGRPLRMAADGARLARTPSRIRLHGASRLISLGLHLGRVAPPAMRL
jgi:hypothetical protein